jgi:predicted regulator of Ras-like GTPase activity (Roadblock/LC7/MglB family)
MGRENYEPLSAESAAELQALLNSITSQPHVVGAMIVALEGHVLANATPSGTDVGTIAEAAFGLYLNSSDLVHRMHQGNRLHQIVLRSAEGFFVVADFGSGLLIAIVSEHKEICRLSPGLPKSIG